MKTKDVKVNKEEQENQRNKNYDGKSNKFEEIF